MRYRLRLALLACGTLAGFASGFASLACHQHHHRAAVERHVARLCADAALAARR